MSELPDDWRPICPHCDSRIAEIQWRTEAATGITVFLCPACKRILSCQIQKPQQVVLTDQVPDEIRDTLRAAIAAHIGYLYDDPDSSTVLDIAGTKEYIKELDAAAKFLGFDLWDRTAIWNLGSYQVTDFEYERLRKIHEISDSEIEKRYADEEKSQDPGN